MDNKFIVYSHVNKITNVTYVGITKCYINAKSVGNITECCKGNKKSYLGYTFNYK